MVLERADGGDGHGYGSNEGEFETWLSAPWPEAARLQRPLPDGALRIVARGEKKDEAR